MKTFVEFLLETEGNRFDKELNSIFKSISSIVNNDNCFIEGSSIYIKVDPTKELCNYINNELSNLNSTVIHSIRIESNYSQNVMKDKGAKIELSFMKFSNKKNNTFEPNYNAYHVTSEKYVDDIIKNGLNPNKVGFKNNEKLEPGNQRQHFVIFVYKALFVTSDWQTCKNIAKHLEIEKPVMITFKPGNVDIYTDYLYESDYEDYTGKSFWGRNPFGVIFDIIPAKNIVKTKKLYK